MNKKKAFPGILAGLILIAMLLCLPVNTVHSRASVKSLKVSGGQIVNTVGKVVQLKGMSTHGLSWYPEYVNEASFRTLKKWGCNTVRLALYTYEYNGYCVSDAANQAKLRRIVDRGVTYAKRQNMYVIIDWHILFDNNPNTYKKQAKAFFKWAASRYKKCPNVIFELCNEPNGDTSWPEIKSYARSVIKVIRNQGSKALCLVGTPTWSQDVDLAVKNPITDDKNVAYTMHFYAATHGKFYRDKLKRALKSHLPIMISEFGITEASGDGRIDKTEAAKWMKLLHQHKIGYMMWSLSNHQAASSILKASCTKKSGWKKTDLKPTGIWFLKQLKK